jgi:hypothetical protein
LWTSRNSEVREGTHRPPIRFSRVSKVEKRYHPRRGGS